LGKRADKLALAARLVARMFIRKEPFGAGEALRSKISIEFLP